jgi:hypothetical protein
MTCGGTALAFSMEDIATHMKPTSASSCTSAVTRVKTSHNVSSPSLLLSAHIHLFYSFLTTFSLVPSVCLNCKCAHFMLREIAVFH